MSSSAPKRVTAVKGQVTKERYGGGSKSERDAVFIDTGRAKWLLRRKTGPVFADPELDRYVGHSVACDGFIVGNTLLAERIEVSD